MTENFKLQTSNSLWLWIPIALVILGDCLHAWLNRAGFLAWEPSPATRFIYSIGGIGLVLGVRLLILSVAFAAALLSRTWRDRITWLYLGSAANLLPALIDCLIHR